MKFDERMYWKENGRVDSLTSVFGHKRDQAIFLGRLKVIWKLRSEEKNT